MSNTDNIPVRPNSPSFVAVTKQYKQNTPYDYFKIQKEKGLKDDDLVTTPKPLKLWKPQL